MIEYLLLAASTLASEDLTCVAAGLLVARGSLSLPAAVLACFLGILVGDIGLYVLGRAAGRRALKWRRLQRTVPESAIARASEWMERRGAFVIFLSRFTPGLRLPTYLMAGISRTRFAPLLFWFAAACLVWTPLLVGGTALFGAAFVHRLDIAGPCLAVAYFIASRNRATRHRILHWEFWPAWLAYLPVIPYVLFLAIRHRSLTLFTAANPGIVAGGLKGESKSRILQHLSSAHGYVPAFRVIQGPRAAEDAVRWMLDNNMEFPIVLKPDVGERGRGVSIVRSLESLRTRLRSSQDRIIIQEYVEGLEFGIFYYRLPRERRGRILSITRKVLPEIAGDGLRSVRELIDADPRAFCLASAYLKNMDGNRVPTVGERVVLVDVAAHSRGAIFLDATDIATTELIESVDRVSRRHPGFYFGRFDVRAESVEALQEGRFRILELNGVGAEATHIYDPRVSISAAYGSLFRQWRIAFEIGRRNRERGHSAASIGDVAALICGAGYSARAGSEHSRSPGLSGERAA